MVAHGTPCLGPVTHAGCGAICPAYDRGCYGCFGPKETPNAASLSGKLTDLGMNGRDLPTGHGAPLRLRLETQLGAKSRKFLRRISVLDDYDEDTFQSIDAGWAWYMGI